MRSISFLVLLFCLIKNTDTTAQTTSHLTYHYTLDLTSIKNDKAEVSLIPPKLKQDSLIFCMPSIVPGTYSVYNFGRFISEVKAYDDNNNKLKIKKINTNQWLIPESKKLSTIKYKVDDTWDSLLEDTVFEPGGTNIDDGKNYIINTFGFFGFFKGYQNIKFELQVNKKPDFFGATSLDNLNSTPNSDLFTSSSYREFADNPIMYTPADTTTLHIGNTDILVAVYSPNKVMDAKIVSKHLEIILNAQKNYLGGKLPVKKYSFLIYLSDKPSLSGNMGALEHSYSSFYFLPEASEGFLASTIRSIAAHEFFHILTPLLLHSEYIRDFDFISPEMSKHLWLYEGVTEYFASHVQVQEGLISPEQFFNVINKKIDHSELIYNDKLAFTDLSKECLGQYADQYGNVYEKGALIGMSLDLLLIKYSDGKYSLKKLIKDLIEKYGKDKPFEEDKLFDIIAEVSGIPETRVFFSKYVEHGTTIPYGKYLSWAGVDYYKEKDIEIFTLGNVDMDVTKDGKIFVTSTKELDKFGKKIGYKKGDVLISLNGQQIDMHNVGQILNEYKQNVKKGDTLEILVKRRGKKEKLLKTKAFPILQHRTDVFERSKKATPRQQMIFDAWLKKS